MGVQLGMPLPGSSNDALQVFVLRLPVEFRSDLGRVGDEFSRVAWPPLGFYDRKAQSGHVLNGLDHLFDRIAPAVADVVNVAAAVDH